MESTPHNLIEDATVVVMLRGKNHPDQCGRILLGLS